MRATTVETIARLHEGVAWAIDGKYGATGSTKWPKRSSQEIRPELEPGWHVGDSGEHAETGEDVERHDDAGARLVRFTVAPILAVEGQVDDPRHIGGGDGGTDHGHDQHQCVGAVAAGASHDAPAAGTGEDLVLGPESRRTGNRPMRAIDPMMKVRKVWGITFRRPPMSVFMSKLCTAWLDRARAEEEAGLEEGVGEEVEEKPRSTHRLPAPSPCTRAG